jgi:polyphosphate kinase 2 (PPK2 family)
VFNRSYYEEVLVVRVHPEYLDAQNLPDRPKLSKLWTQRYEAIRNHELHLARNGMVVLKFWLNVSAEEQAKRFRARLEDPSKNWKFSRADLEERKYWDDYMKAYEKALNATSVSWAPWYAIPADDKSYMQVVVADIIVRSLKKLPLAYPKIPEKREREFAAMRAELES